MNAKVKAIYGENINDLADQLNNFSKNTDTISTQVFQTSEGYEALIYYFERDLEVVKIVEKISKPVEKETSKPLFELATQKQKNLLFKLKIKFDKDLTKNEASKLIQENINTL